MISFLKEYCSFQINIYIYIYLYIYYMLTIGYVILSETMILGEIKLLIKTINYVLNMLSGVSNYNGSNFNKYLLIN